MCGVDRRAVLATALAVAGTVAVLAGAAHLTWPPRGGPPDVGGPAAVVTDSPPAPAPPRRADPSGQPLAAGAEPPIAGWPPTRIALPAGPAPVVPVTVDRQRRLRVPDDPHAVGWWVGGAAAGARAGTVLVAGHVDAAGRGPGTFAALHGMAVGDAVRLDTAAGPVTYQMTGRRTYDKQRLPADLFRSDGPPRLVLVTCGGAFRDGRYDRNVVVYASPVGRVEPDGSAASGGS